MACVLSPDLKWFPLHVFLIGYFNVRKDLKVFQSNELVDP